MAPCLQVDYKKFLNAYPPLPVVHVPGMITGDDDGLTAVAASDAAAADASSSGVQSVPSSSSCVLTSDSGSGSSTSEAAGPG